MSERSDADLMLAFQRERNYEAFEQLFSRHKDALFRYLLRLAGHRPTAEDASQQTWLKVIDVARSGGYEERPAVAFRTWVFTLARNHFIDHYKRSFAEARSVPLSDHDDALGSEPHDLIEAAETNGLLRRAMLALPFEQRDVVSLWAAGVEIDQIAAMTNAPRETVLSRKKYAISKLRAAIASTADEEGQA
jgi:RNA polymerase sigma-70 factor, ECF subfamily